MGGNIIVPWIDLSSIRRWAKRLCSGRELGRLRLGWFKLVALRGKTHHFLELAEELESSANQGVIIRAYEKIFD